MATPISPSARLQELLPQLMQPAQQPGVPFLRFQLLEDTVALLPMTQVREAMVLPATQVTALPNMPEAVIGLMSSRSSVFGLIDLPHALGFPGVIRTSRQYQVIVVATDNTAAAGDETLLGLAVPNVQGIIRLETGIIGQEAQRIRSELYPYLLGSVSEADGQIPVLSAAAIAKCDRLT